MSTPGPINIFIIYAREDTEVKNDFLLHLLLLEEEFNIYVWHDQNIEGGQEWDQKIISQIEKTDLFILLISVHSLGSQYIRDIELKNAIERYKAKKSTLVPVIIKPCQWKIRFQNFNLDQLQVLPKNTQPIINWRAPDEFYDAVTEGIAETLKTIRQQKEQVEAERIKRQQAQEQESKRQKEEEQRELQEKTYWETASGQNTIIGYEKYIQKYPNGKYTKTARAYINRLKQQQEEEKKLHARQPEAKPKTQPEVIKKADTKSKKVDKSDPYGAISPYLYRIPGTVDQPDWTKYPYKLPASKPLPVPPTPVTKKIEQPAQAATAPVVDKRYKYKDDPLWWCLILPIMMAISIAATYAGYFAASFVLLKIFTYRQELIGGINNSINSTGLLAAIGIIWGIVYAISGGNQALKRTNTFAVLLEPYKNIFASFTIGALSAPVINLFVCNIVIFGLIRLSLVDLELGDAVLLVVFIIIILAVQLFSMWAFARKYN